MSSDINKPILCLDFDGVIHSYSSGWKGANVIPDPPVPGAIEALYAYAKAFEVHIYSSRSHQPGGIEAMRTWLFDYTSDDHFAFNVIQWPEFKPAALVTIDDRAITFTGVWPPLDELAAFKPWNKR